MESVRNDGFGGWGEHPRFIGACREGVAHEWTMFGASLMTSPDMRSVASISNQMTSRSRGSRW